MFRIALTIGLFLAMATCTVRGESMETEITPRTLLKQLKEKHSLTQDAPQIAEKIRAWFGKDNLPKGSGPRVEEMTAVWAVEAPSAKNPPRLFTTDGSFTATLIPVEKTGLYVYAQEFPNDTAFSWWFEVDGKRLGDTRSFELFREDPDCHPQSNVPKGVVTQMPKWNSTIFAGTSRDWWVYVPAQYTPDKPACVMVFQDGQWAKNYTPPIFDNLIAKGEMPVTVGVFITPGTFENGRSNRSFEYDTLSDQYVRFLLEEMLPEVEKTTKLRHDAASRAIAGISSGGICAFTAAWERPNEFSKVLSWVGSFTNIASGSTRREGGHNYAALIRKTPLKPIRVFLQDGANDLDNEHGSWPLANQEMAKSLAYKSYDYKFVYGNGFHSDRHGRAIMPDSLRWLWRDYKTP